MKVISEPCASLDAPIASRFAIVRQWRRPTEQDRQFTLHPI